MAEPENLMLPILREIRAEVKDMRAEMAPKSDLAEVRSELHSEIRSLAADVASDMVDMEKRLGDRIATLNRAVMEYHSTTIGHGVHCS